MGKAAGTQTRPAHSPTGTALRGVEGEGDPQREGLDGRMERSREERVRERGGDAQTDKRRNVDSV